MIGSRSVLRVFTLLCVLGLFVGCAKSPPQARRASSAPTAEPGRLKAPWVALEQGLATPDCVQGVFREGAGCIALANRPEIEFLAGLSLGEIERRVATMDPGSLATLEALAMLGRRSPSGSWRHLNWYRQAAEAGDRMWITGVRFDSVHEEIFGEAKYVELTQEFVAIWPDEETGNCPAKTLADLYDHITWPEAVGRSGFVHSLLLDAVKLQLRFRVELVQRAPTSRWGPVAELRQGLFRLHLARAIEACTPDNVELFSRDERREMTELSNLGKADVVKERSGLRLSDFLVTRAGWSDSLQQSAFRFLAIGATMARAFGVFHPLVAEAQGELHDLRRVLGDATSIQVLQSIPDPVDPHKDGKRTLAPLLEALTAVP